MSGVALWGISRSEYLLSRSRLAHEVLDEHLRLAESGQRLLRLAAIPVTPHSRGAAKEAAVRAQIDGQLKRVRGLIAAEAALVGSDEDEAVELDRLAEIEFQLAATVHAHEQVRAMIVAGRERQGLARLGELNSGGAAAQWRRLVAAAIDEESREAATVDKASEKLADRLQFWLTTAAIAAAVLAIGALAFLRRDLDRPLARLMAGTKALAVGDLGHRIGLPGNGELPRLARSFDRMATEIEAQQAALSAARGGLEVEVAERTAELVAANARLAALDSNRRRLLADISHELRTPLTVVRGEAEVTLRGGARPVGEYVTALARILEQARHMGRLVDDLLFQARQEAGELRLQTRLLNLGELVRRACSDMDVLARDRRGTVACEVPSHDIMVQGDADRIRQLLFILVDNALRYSESAPAVTVDVHGCPQGAVLRVADRGLGIPEDDLPLVFERFQRGANAARHDKAGSGLGLFMARAIVAAHGGSIGIESIEGMGTTVTVILSGVAPLRLAS